MPTTTEIFENALKTLAKKEEKAFPASVDLPRSYPAVSNTMSPLALGSTAAIGATAAFPDEGESASIPASKLEASLKRALSPKTFNSIPEETMQGLKKWTGRNVTEELGYADQPATEALDSNFLAQGLASKDYLKYDPDTMIKLRQAQAVTPENTLARANLSVGFLPKDDPREGMLSVFGKNNSVMYNPQKPNFNPFKNVGHEIGGHVPQVIRMDGSFSPRLDHKLAFLNEAGENTSRILNNVPYAASLINSDFYKTAPKETQELIDFAFKVYRNSPPEIVARNMGEMYNRTLRAGDFGYLKDPENFNDIYGKFASKAYMDFTNENPETSAKILGKLKSKYALPTAAIGAYGLSGEDKSADASLTTQLSDKLKPFSNASEMSNIDKVANIGSYVNSDLSIPSGDIGGDFSAGASGAISAIKGVVGGAGGIAHRTMKSLGKVIDIATGQTNARSKPLDGDDYERVINAATAFFAPEKVALNTAINAGFDWVDPSEVGAGSELTSEMLSGKQEFRTTPYEQRTVPEAVQNIALGAGAAGLGVLASKSKLLKNEAGAIQLEGFFSPLSKALKDRVVGKSVLSDKMTGEQVLKTLRSAGIKEDELVFSGVGDALMAIGKTRVGASKMEEISKIAEDGALGFKRNDSPGVYSSYSLFREGDPSFKNAVYTYPGVEFEEGHFGKGVVAHRRFGDKELSVPNSRKEEFDKAINLSGPSGNLELDRDKARLRELGKLYKNNNTEEDRILLHEYNNIISKYTGNEKVNSLLLDEVQSQFHEKGSRFGYGGMKGLPEGVDLANSSQNYKNFHAAYKDAALGDYSKVPENMKIDMDRYVKVGDIAENADRSTPQGFAAALSADEEASRIYSRYVPEADQSVENAPLRGEKYVELLAKDHLRDALASGKDSISWTPSDVQHKRYYGKDALGKVEWDFILPRELGNLESSFGPPVVKGRSRIRITFLNGKELYQTTVEELNKNIGATATKKLLEDMQNGLTSGTLEGGSKEVYQKLYDRAIPKAFEKLTGEKPRKGFVKDRNGDDVEIMWIPLNETKKKMVVTPGKEGDFKALEKSLSSHPQEEFDIKGQKELKNTEEYIKQSKKSMEENNLTKSKTYKKIEEDLNKIRDFKEKYLPKVKDLPIAHSQEVLDFFEPSEKQQAMA